MAAATAGWGVARVDSSAGDEAEVLRLGLSYFFLLRKFTIIYMLQRKCNPTSLTKICRDDS